MASFGCLFSGDIRGEVVAVIAFSEACQVFEVVILNVRAEPCEETEELDGL